MLASLRTAAVLLLGIPLALRAEPIHIAGRVQAGTLKPVAARIELLPQTGETPAVTAKADAEGFFELTAPESGCYRVRLQAPGYASVERPLPVTEETGLLVPLVPVAEANSGSELYDGWIFAAPAAAAPPPVTPRLLQGKVMDAKEAPIPGALVWSVGSPAVPCARAGADGSFQIRLPADGEAKVRAAAPGYLASAPQTQAPGSQTPFQLQLQEAGAITGQVQDAAGHPLARVQVTALPSSLGEGLPAYGVAWSGTDGRFRLSPLSLAALYEVTGRREGFAPASLKTTALARGRQPAPVRIVLEIGATAFGRVVDREGKPVPDARLTLQSREEGEVGLFVSEGGLDVARTKTDSQGSFRFEHLNPGRLHLRIECKGFAPFAPVDVEIPRTGRVDLGTRTLDRGQVLAGKVVDPHGVPMPGATVELKPTVIVFSEIEMANAFQEQTTDADGRFRFEDLRRGARLDLSVTSPGYPPAAVQSVEVPAPEPLTITLKAGRSLAGRVTSPAGEPVRNADISLQEQRVVRSSLGDIQTGAARVLGTTDEEGGFRVQGVEPGAAELRITALGYRSKSQSVQVPEDSDVEGVEISLEKTGVLEVHVLDAAGAPVPEAEPQLTRVDSRAWKAPILIQCRTDAEGRCRMEGLDIDPGWYRLSARVEGRGHAETTLEVKAAGVIARDLVLHKGVEVSGRVSDDAGDPVPGATLTLQLQPVRPEGTPMIDISSADGSFRFTDVEDGTFRLSGKAPGFAESQAPGEIQVAGQEVHGLELRFSRGARVTGKLLGLDPEEAKSVIVIAIRPDPTSQQAALGNVDPEGRYRIENLGPGEWAVTATTNGRSVMEPLHLAPGAREAVLDLRFQNGFTLSGRVLLDHAPLAGAQVMAFTSTRTSQAVAGPDGGFRLSELPADHYVLVALDSGQEMVARRSVEIAGDQEVTFDIVTGGLRGRVSVAGAPVAGALLRLEEGDVADLSGPLFPASQILAKTTDGAGTVEIPRLPAGLYKITVEKEGFAPATVEVQVLPGGMVPVEIELRPAG